VNVHISPSSIDTTLDKIQFEYDVLVAQGQKSSIKKIGGYTVSLNHKTRFLLLKSNTICFSFGLRSIIGRKRAWSKIWEMSDITIEGDVKAQQEFVLISFNSTKPT
jgi:maltose phosphorylase